MPVIKSFHIIEDLSNIAPFPFPGKLDAVRATEPADLVLAILSIPVLRMASQIV
jgi:hypothetical protein